MSRTDRGLVVVCGAGISIEPPSQLPNGEELTQRVIELLLDSDDVVLDLNDILELRTAAQSIRLELALELLSRHIEVSKLVQVYTLLLGAIPNHNHLALACANISCIITTNQDVLLESAATLLGTTPEILHLHGRCDQPETIVTLISQYMAGLLPDEAQALREALEGQVVLVVGYSGRDRDVMMVLGESGSTHIRWILHPGSIESFELCRLRHRLGDRLDLEALTAHEELAGLLTRHQKKHVAKILGSLGVHRYEIPSAVRGQFAHIGRVERNLGLAEILRHASRFREVDRIYSALGGMAPDSPIAVRLAMGSTFAHRGMFDPAIEAYETVVASDATAVERCL